MIKSIAERQLEVFLGGANEMNVTIYNISGQPVLTQSCEGDEIMIDASDIESGVYLVNVNGVHNQRVLIK